MKEVFTKSFWQAVKKTFDEAREGPPLANTASQTPAKGDQRSSSTPETPSSPSISSEPRSSRESSSKQHRNSEFPTPDR
jgi:hypothetical protein